MIVNDNVSIYLGKKQVTEVLSIVCLSNRAYRDRDRDGDRRGGLGSNRGGLGSSSINRGFPGRFGGGGGGGGNRFGGRPSSGRDMGGGLFGNNSFKNRQPGEQLRKPRWDMSSLQPFSKDFYRPHPNVCNRSPHVLEAYRSDKEITVKGTNVPNPSIYFEEGGFPDYVMTEIRRQGFGEPTAIQVSLLVNYLLTAHSQKQRSFV